MIDKQSIKISLTFIGTLIGAGFASGKEISLYFLNASIFTVLSAGLFCGFLCFIFVELGRRTSGKIELLLFGKLSNVGTYIIKISNFAVFCAMMAGSEMIIRNATGYIGGGLITSILALAIINCGLEHIKILNVIVVPLILIMIIVVYASVPTQIYYDSFSISSPILYASMNILSGGYLISRISNNIKKKQSIKIAIISAIFISVMLIAIYAIVNQENSSAMPMLSAASKVKLGGIASMIIYLAIFTTMVSGLSIASENVTKTAIIMITVSIFVSSIGFAKLVDTVYPIMGVMGVGLTLLAFIALIKIKKLQRISLPNNVN